VIGHLHDLDFIDFFKRCAASLKQYGFIFMKENCPMDYTFVVDKVDSSVSRNVDYIRVLVSFADLEVVLLEPQEDFPTELYPVYMFALRPKPK
jgi:protein N-terminal methyltransferase